MRVALGLKARTGRAILVAVAEGAEPGVVGRRELPLLPAGDFAPYHAAEGLAPAAARASVAHAIAAAHRLAQEGIRRAAEDLRSAGHEIGACGVLVGPALPPWSTEQILAVHVRMHQAEGVLFRDVLVAGVQACGLPLLTLREKLAFGDAAAALGITPPEFEARLAALGRRAGPPWTLHQRQAAAAAMVALAAPASLASPMGSAR